MSVGLSVGATLKMTLSAPTTFDATGYAALTYTKVGEITNYGEYGPENETVTTTPVDTGIAQQLAGPENQGTLALTINIDKDDAGQTMMKQARASRATAYFEVTYPDGVIHYFPAKVTSWKYNIGAANSVTTATSNLALTTSKSGVGIVEVLPDDEA